MVDEILGKENTDVVRSIRISKALDSTLKEHSKATHTSVNRLIYSILIKYAEWDFMAERFGMVSVPREVLRNILDSTDDEKLVEASERLGKSIASEMMNFWFHRNDLNTLLRLMSLSSKYAKMFKYEVEQNGENKFVIALKHEFGEKGTIIFKTVARESIMALTGIEPKFEGNNSTLLIKI